METNQPPLEFFVSTSDFDWGKGVTIDQALTNAHFRTKLDWINIYIGYGLAPGACCGAEGNIVAYFRLNLANYRRK